MRHTILYQMVKSMLVSLPLLWSACAVTASDRSGSLTLIGPGVISTDSREFATSLSPDGNALYFNRSDIPGIWQIWVSGKREGGWAGATKIQFSDQRYTDADPFVSRSGDRLYFSSDRPLPGSSNTAPTQDTNTWFAPLVNGEWGQPIYAGPVINSDASETFISESASGLVLFARFGEGRGRARPTSLMTAQRNGEGFSDLKKIDTRPTTLRLSNPAISPDGTLIVAPAIAGDKPQLFYSRKLASGEWREFQLLPAPINLPESGQFAPYIANDGNTLYFSSDRPAKGAGDDNIYRASLPSEVTSQH